jgi:hypothetical protein
MCKPIVAPFGRAALLVFLSLLSLCPSVFAGSYKVTYSKSGGDDACYYMMPDAYNGLSSPVGYLGVYWGNPYGPTSGDGSCSATIKATFTWESSTNEPAPKSAIVVETARAFVQGGWTAGAPGSLDASNGLDTPTTRGGDPWYGSALSDNMNSSTYAAKYTVETGDTAEFTRECAPTISASGTGSEAPGDRRARHRHRQRLLQRVRQPRHHQSQRGDRRSR